MSDQTSLTDDEREALLGSMIGWAGDDADLDDCRSIAAHLTPAVERIVAGRVTVPPGLCWHNSGITWPNDRTPRCELRAGHAGAHECDRGEMGGYAVWTESIAEDRADTERELAEARGRLAAVEALIPDECWVLWVPLAGPRCTDMIGGGALGGVKWTEDMCCLPCRLRAALAPEDRP